MIVATALQRHNLPLAALAAVIFGSPAVDGRAAWPRGYQPTRPIVGLGDRQGVRAGRPLWSGQATTFRWLLQLVVVCAVVQVRLLPNTGVLALAGSDRRRSRAPSRVVLLATCCRMPPASTCRSGGTLAINGVALYAPGSSGRPDPIAPAASRFVSSSPTTDRSWSATSSLSLGLDDCQRITVVRLLPAAVSGPACSRRPHMVRRWPRCFISLDMVDGYVARSRGEVTVIGRYLDVVIDKAFLLAVLTAGVAVGAVPTWLAVLSIGRVVSIAVAAVVATRRGAPLPRNVWSAAANVAALAAVVSSSITWELLAVGLATQNVIAYVLPVIRRLTLSDQRTEHQGAFNEDA